MGHVFLPEPHRLSDHIRIQARRLQVGCCAQPIRTRTNNDNFLGFHRLRMLLERKGLLPKSNWRDEFHESPIFPKKLGTRGARPSNKWTTIRFWATGPYF